MRNRELACKHLLLGKVECNRGGDPHQSCLNLSEHFTLSPSRISFPAMDWATLHTSSLSSYIAVWLVAFSFLFSFFEKKENDVMK